MFTRLKWHFSGINTHFRPTTSLFSTFFAVVSSPFLFYFKCKYFAILLSIRQKADFFFVLFDRPLLQAERSDSQAVGKSKCHFDTSPLCIRYFKGERPVLRTKNLPKTDWSEKPSSSAISFTSLSVHSNSLRASAQSSSNMWKQTVCPVILRTIRER